MDETLKQQFKDPGADMRSIPFWSWNGKMEEDEVRRQIQEMKQAGVGGFFMHSRVGLETEYLGEQWMRCVKAAVDEAKKQGLYAWIYDEDRWPSGTAGGRVTSCGDAYRCKGLTMETLAADRYQELYKAEIVSDRECREEPLDQKTGFLAAYAAVIDGDCVQSFRRLALRPDEVIEADESLLAVRLDVSAPSEWFNNEAPPDNLNPDCVKKFIEETHERYKAVVGEEFGKTVLGFFTDEPSLHDRFTYFGETKSWIPWTFGYGAYFKSLAGYDFFDVLPLFYFHGEGSLKVRHDYWQSIAKRYGESYFKTLGDWCENNHLLFTGHYLQEDKLGLCTRVNGAVMPHYQYMHIPGVDLLCEQTGEYLTLKQCTSVANQLGKKQVLSETYGCTGWEFTFEGQKWVGDWQYVLGVNRRCQHLMLYSLRGCRKRDYPPSFNYNTNWWRENKIVEDYFARLSVVLERGTAVRNVLLMHPASTAWERLGVNPYGNPKRREERDVPAINEYGNRFNDLIEFLEREHIDCDLGDEILIQERGAVHNGSFWIGKAGYRAVVLPPMDTILDSTCQKLLAYMEQGGMVYVMQPGPCRIGGAKPEGAEYARMVSHKNWIPVAGREELLQKLDPVRTLRIEDCLSRTECRDVLYQLRHDENCYYLFLVNNSREREADVLVKLPFAAEVEAMDLLSGEVRREDMYRETEDGLQLRVCLEKAGSALYCLTPLQRKKTEYAGPFRYRMDHNNVLVLDRCRYRIGDREWSDEMEVWKAQKQIREQKQMRSIESNEIVQRYKWIRQGHPEDGFLLELAFSFELERVPSRLAAAIERPEDFTLYLNGQRVEWQTDGWLLDREIKTCRLPEGKPGMNELILQCRYRQDMELETIYLTGVFGVDENRRITCLPETIMPGDWTAQGFFHYCGSISYLMDYPLSQRPKGNVWLKLPEIRAVCVRVRVNGQEQLIPWNFERRIPIGAWLKEGDNPIEIEVIGSPRNMMGPFHIKEKPSNTNVGSFFPPDSAYCKSYLLTPYGLMGTVEIEQENES